MRTMFMLLLAAIIAAGCSSANKDVDIPQKELEFAATVFGELNAALKIDNGQLWNYSLQGPLMLVNRDTRTIIANEADSAGELSPKGELFVGTLPVNINIANTSFNWNGKQWTMVSLPLSEIKEKRLNLLIHESFHTIQPLIGFGNISEIQCGHLDTKQGRILIKQELEALKEALNSSTPENHLKNAIYFRQHRHQLFPNAQSAENSLELLEGLAEYTVSILSQRTDTALKTHYSTSIRNFYSLPTYVRSFAYFTIPVYGYYMQKTDSNWNLQVNQNTNLSEFIGGFFGVIPKEYKWENILKMGKEYGIDKIIDDETKREAERQQLMAVYKSTFLGNRNLSIKLENMRIGFNPTNIMPLDSFGTVYPNLRIVDNWGILEVDRLGALISPSWNRVTVSYPESITDTLITGKGWRLKPNKLWKVMKENEKITLIKE